MPFGLGMVLAEIPGHSRMRNPSGGLGVAVGVVADEREHWISRGLGWRRFWEPLAGGEAC